ncbi:MAG TPA: cytochrome c3 family protein [Nitrospiraceae bacterium]|jgi:nitrate/TMAO reductase-like tetraheme cytochrome c subunit|nr:cytochrome c3 family protein [Nitrospiraceae bacterium]
MRRRPQAVAVLAIIAGAFIFGGVAVPLTNHPKFCASCHNIRPSHDTWKASTHKDVTCVACHVRPGLEGWLHDKAWSGTKDLAIYLFGTPTDAHNLEAKVDSDVCMNCHQAVLRVSEVAPRDLPPPVKDVGLVMSHRRHMEAFGKQGRGEGCTTCHSRIVHGTPIKGYPIIIPRGHVSEDSRPYEPAHPEGTKLRASELADCFRCHDGKTQYEGKVLSNRCETCHLPEKLDTFLFN